MPNSSTGLSLTKLAISFAGTFGSTTLLVWFISSHFRTVPKYGDFHFTNYYQEFSSHCNCAKLKQSNAECESEVQEIVPDNEIEDDFVEPSMLGIYS